MTDPEAVTARPTRTDPATIAEVLQALSGPAGSVASRAATLIADLAACLAAVERSFETAQARADAAEQALRTCLAKQSDLAADAAQVMDDCAARVTAAEQALAEARRVLNPNCDEETVVGGIRNLQQALLSTQGNLG